MPESAEKTFRRRAVKLPSCGKVMLTFFTPGWNFTGVWKAIDWASVKARGELTHMYFKSIKECAETFGKYSSEFGNESSNTQVNTLVITSDSDTFIMGHIDDSIATSICHNPNL